MAENGTLTANFNRLWVNEGPVNAKVEPDFATQRANNTIHASASEIGRLRRQLEAEMQQSVAVGPVVRNVWQQRPS